MDFGYFGLTEDPFQLTPKVEHYCPLPEFEQVLGSLKYIYHQQEGFSLVMAEIGSGKTLLCRKLLHFLQEEDAVVAYLYNPSFTPIELARMILKECRVRVKSSSADYSYYYEKLQQYLLKAMQHKQRVVVVIDEAQTMSNESLEFIRHLTNLETSTQKLLQVFMFAQPDMRAILNQVSMRQLKHRITHTFELKRLSREQSDYFVKSKLDMSGADRDILTPKALRAVWELSRGNPRSASILAKRSLLSAYARGEKMVSHHDVKYAAKELKPVLSAVKYEHDFRRSCRLLTWPMFDFSRLDMLLLMMIMCLVTVLLMVENII